MNAHSIISRILLVTMVLLCGQVFSIAKAYAAAVVCVTTSQELQDALDSASDGGANSGTIVYVYLAKGTYKIGAATSNGPFKFHSTSATSELILTGGYDATCKTVTFKAAETILDGGGTSQVLNLISQNGAVDVINMTIQNGNSDQQGGGLSINNAQNAGTEVAITNCIIRNNHSSANGGGVAVYSAGEPGDYHEFIGNALYGNSSDTTYGAGFLSFGGTAVWFYNNTIYNNTAAGSNAVGGFGCCGTVTAAVEIAGNIIWQNTNYGIDLYGTPPELTYNDYGTRSGDTPAVEENSIHVDPKFANAGADDLHLGQGSPLIGFVPKNYTLSNFDDLEGHPRNVAAFFDAGAYAETIFDDQFGGAGN